MRWQIIRAHTVQNSKVLDLLVRDGHVVSLRHWFEQDKGPVIGYKLVGRNEATTFTGLCDEHDREIFRPIDTNDINIENQQHLFLLAYRAVLRGLHATMEGVLKIQSVYLKRVELDLDPKNQPSQAGMEAVAHMMKSWRTFRYKYEYDQSTYQRPTAPFAMKIGFLTWIVPHSPLAYFFQPTHMIPLRISGALL